MTARALLREVNRVLWTEWDPIGCGVPEDEYESYAPEVLRLLTGGADSAALAAHLARLAKEALACPISDAKASHAAASLLALQL